MLLFTAFAIVGLSLGCAAFLAASRLPLVRRFGMPVLLLLLCAHAVLQRFPATEWALFPWPAHAFVRGFVLYPLATMFFGLAAARLPIRWNQVVVALVALAVLGHGLHRHRWLVWPEQHGGDRTADARHHLQQSTPYTCGPAACVAALSHCGVEATERQLSDWCLTRRAGTSLFDLYRGLVTALDGRPFSVSIEALTAAQLLATDHLVVCSRTGGGHAICVATATGQVQVHDPLQKAPTRWTPAELQAEYLPPAIVIRPADSAAAPARPPR